MCEPISMTVAALSTANSVVQQRNAIKAQKKVQANASAQERARYLNEVSVTRQRQRQEQIVAAQQLQESQTQAMEARATARTSAGESGVSGLSVDALIGDLTRQEAEYNFSIQQQQQFQEQNTNNVLEAAGLGFTANMLRINKPIPKTDYFGAALQGAQTGLSFYNSANKAGMFKKDVIDAPDMGTYGVDHGIMNRK
tara:strand:+ start:2435 stop:3025 length:591 start_codon:yes stop_codon:yes gene_type:complete